MSISNRLNRVGILPIMYKLKHLLLTPSKEVVSMCSLEGAYEYLLRYSYACQKRDTMPVLQPCGKAKYIWVCWLQGLETAPLLVQRCVESIRKYANGMEVVVLTDKNISKYVDIPSYIYDKLKRGCMGRTHFSDILRLHLLSQYGGVWIDSTMLMTGVLPEYILNSPLFMYHSVLFNGPVCCANGFMASCPHHPIIDDTLAMWKAYWQKEDRLISYSVTHIFLSIAIRNNPINTQLWESVPLYYYVDCEKLRIKLNTPFDAEEWKEIRRFSDIHKLTYKFDEYHIDPTLKGTFYDVLINQGDATQGSHIETW